MTTRRATGGVWTKTQVSVTVGTEGTAARGRLVARAATGEAAAQGRVNLPEREGEPLVQTGGVLLEEEAMEEERVVVEGVVGEEEGVIKDKTAPPVVVTTVALLTLPSALCPARPARSAAAPSWWRA